MKKSLVQLAFSQTNILGAEATVLNLKLDCIVFQYVQCEITNVHNAYTNIRIVLNFRVSIFRTVKKRRASSYFIGKRLL